MKSFLSLLLVIRLENQNRNKNHKKKSIKTKEVRFPSVLIERLKLDHHAQNTGEVRIVSAQVLAQLQAAGYQV